MLPKTTSSPTRIITTRYPPPKVVSQSVASIGLTPRNWTSARLDRRSAHQRVQQRRPARVGGGPPILFGDFEHNLFPRDLHVGRRLDADANAAPIGGKDDETDVVADEDRLTFLATENQHQFTIPRIAIAISSAAW